MKRIKRIVTGVGSCLLLFPLAGCTSLVERQILNMEPVRGMASVEQVVAPNRRKICDETLAQRCLHYLDLADVEALYEEGEKVLHKDFTWTLTLRSNMEKDRAINDYFSEETLFQFPELMNDSPIAIVAPGYGMRSAHLFAPTGVWLRSLGIRPLILEGPTERKPMAFGLPELALIRDYVSDHYANAPIVLVGFSMGMMAITELELLFKREEVTPAALVFVAPMTDFRSDANFMFRQIKEKDWRVRWFVSESRFNKALANIILRSGEAERLTNLGLRLMATESPALVLVGRDDKVVDVNDSRAAVEAWLGINGLERLGDYPEEPVSFPLVLNTPNEAIERYRTFQVGEGKDRYIEYEMLGHSTLITMLMPVREDVESWLEQLVEFRKAPPELDIPEVM
ncbi:hypothetical protein [Aliidiomarina sp.]|uniref:hypothetical protein n=1 Tax=Aliidiomarina sp. TaxID=1872439 RepID=UPI003A4D5736